MAFLQSSYQENAVSIEAFGAEMVLFFATVI
jgi:hypothetical protein